MSETDTSEIRETDQQLQSEAARNAGPDKPGYMAPPTGPQVDAVAKAMDVDGKIDWASQDHEGQKLIRNSHGVRKWAS